METETFDLDAHEALPPLTSDYVLSQVDDVLIFRYYFGDFALGRKVKSPFQKTHGPHFSITLNRHWMKLQYKDWSTGEVGDCFKFVSRLRGITYPEAIHMVACDFGLLKGCTVVTKKQIQEAKDFKEAMLQQDEYLIQVDIRPMSQAELDYWAQYNINQKDLKANHIYGIKTLWVNRKQVFLRPGLHFAYHFPTVDKFKIYSPLEKEWKWFGNVSAFTVEGLDKIEWDKLPSNGNYMEPVDGNSVIITKSRKDRIILKKLYHNVVNCQNEAETAIPKEMDEVFNQCEAKYIWFDSDEVGKNASKKLNSRGYKWINVPNDLYEKLGLKDPGDVVKHFGWDEGSKLLTKELKKKGLL